jgi:hypothetical protein
LDFCAVPCVKPSQEHRAQEAGEEPCHNRT